MAMVAARMDSAGMEPLLAHKDYVREAEAAVLNIQALETDGLVEEDIQAVKLKGKAHWRRWRPSSQLAAW